MSRLSIALFSLLCFALPALVFAQNGSAAPDPTQGTAPATTSAVQAAPATPRATTSAPATVQPRPTAAPSAPAPVIINLGTVTVETTVPASTPPVGLIAIAVAALALIGGAYALFRQKTSNNSDN